VEVTIRLSLAQTVILLLLLLVRRGMICITC
jgi:hypothetical protein